MSERRVLILRGQLRLRRRKLSVIPTLSVYVSVCRKLSFSPCRSASRSLYKKNAAACTDYMRPAAPYLMRLLYRAQTALRQADVPQFHVPRIRFPRPIIRHISKRLRARSKYPHQERQLSADFLKNTAKLNKPIQTKPWVI